MVEELNWQLLFYPSGVHSQQLFRCIILYNIESSITVTIAIKQIIYQCHFQFSIIVTMYVHHSQIIFLLCIYDNKIHQLLVKSWKKNSFIYHIFWIHVKYGYFETEE